MVGETRVRARGPEFLRWALPRLRLRWPGFRKVRRQVLRRVGRRVAELRLPDLDAYRAYLAAHPEEWSVLDHACRITISRFGRDRPTWERLGGDVLPALAARARAAGRGVVRAWSVGCASGEEPYTLSLLWRLGLGAAAADLCGPRGGFAPPRSPPSPRAARCVGGPERESARGDLWLDVLGTDVDPRVLERARAAVYPRSVFRELPDAWRRAAFKPVTDERGGRAYALRAPYREGVTFTRADVRREQPPGPFDLILCRNLAFLYFAVPLQEEVLPRLRERLRPGGALVLGDRDALPPRRGELEDWFPAEGIYRRPGAR